MIATWSQGPANQCMAEDILTELIHVIQRHPWWHARVRFVLALLKRKGVLPPAQVLDAGCGWGVNLDALEQHGYKAAGLDISRHTLQRLDRHGRELYEADITQVLPDSVKQYDAVLALDVIEHLDNDRLAVSRLGQLTKPGGIAIISVPALPELYSEFDSVQGHRRRYVPDTLRAAFEESDLELEHILWWGKWMVPVIRLQRWWRGKKAMQGEPNEIYRQYLKLPPWPGTQAFRMAFAMEQPLALRGWISKGTSLFAVARRRS